MHRPLIWAKALACRMRQRLRFALPPAVLIATALAAGPALAHAVAEGDKGYIQEITGVNLIPFVYLGAKHMVTGYDHLLFLVGVIFFLYRTKDILLYVSLFTIGHSVTLLLGALGGLRADPHLVDAIIGLSIVYKGFENLGGFKSVLGWQPDTRVAVLVFGLFHGLGLATKLQDFALSKNGLVANIVSFNIGVGAGAHRGTDRAQLLADARWLPAARLRDERGPHDGRVHLHRRSTHGLLHRTMTTQIEPAAQSALPSQRRLAQTTAMAAAVAALILVTIVLPAEYGLDPLGTGRALGLTQMSAPAPAVEEPPTPAGGQALVPVTNGPIALYPAAYKTDSTQFVLGPYEFVEYKYHLELGATMLFSWNSTAAVVHDFHGDPAATPDAPVSFEKKDRRQASGTFTAPFRGIHGWFWENPGGEAITISLTTAGFYTSALEIRSDRTRKTHELR